MTELRKAYSRNFSAVLLIAVFSICVNMLMLTSPLFMLQVYDRVIPSRSEPTLVALFLLVAGLFAAYGLLDYVRGRIGARIGARIQSDLDARVFTAALTAPGKARAEAVTGLADLEAVRRFFASPVAFAGFDLPFTPIFIVAIFIFHPLLGWLAVGGGVLLVAISLTNQLTSRRPGELAARTAAGSARLAEQMRTQPETIRGLGMTQAAILRWRQERDTALSAEMALQDRNGGFSSMTRSLRFFLQSAMLGAGAWLVLRSEMTSGAMIAGSILMGRALAPIEQLIGGWSVVLRARKGWRSLEVLLDAVPEAPPRSLVRRPAARLTLDNVTVAAPHGTRAILRQVSFAANPGEVIGVIGESASGKSSIARVLVGLWVPSAGEVRLDGATLDQYDPEALADYIGYLPQDIALFDGTVAENIARLRSGIDSDAVIRAAEMAGAHEMILQLPQGYDTEVGAVGVALSGGQKQRIGLARAMFGDPVALVLDEPNSNLDAPGSAAVNAAIRRFKAEGRIVIVMAHRPAALAECDKLVVMQGGTVAAFGPRDEILRQNTANHAQIIPARPEPVTA